MLRTCARASIGSYRPRPTTTRPSRSNRSGCCAASKRAAPNFGSPTTRATGSATARCSASRSIRVALCDFGCCVRAQACSLPPKSHNASAGHRTPLTPEDGTARPATALNGVAHRQELAHPVGLGVVDDLARMPRLDDTAVGHEDERVAHVTREGDLVG